MLETFEVGEGDSFSGCPDTTQATIEVIPPISIGDVFGDVIFGIDGSVGSIDVVASTQERTILLSEVGIHDLDEQGRLLLVEKVVARVALFVNNPQTALTMMQESPFEETSEL